MSPLTTFAGRVEELQKLFQYLANAARQEPQLVLIEGASGSGKSKLLREFARRLSARGNEVTVVAVSAPADRPYDPILLAAREATHQHLYDRVGGRRTARELLPDWLGAIPGVGNLIGAIVATVQLLRERRRPQNTSPVSGDDATDALLDAGTSRTLVLLLDDLDGLDRAGAARIEALMRTSARRARLLVAGPCGPPVPGTRPSPFRAMVEVLPPTMVCRLSLRELSSDELASWLRKRFPHVEIPDSFLEWLKESTGGHPAAVEEMLDRLISRSVIRFVDRHWKIGERPNDLEVSAGGVPAINLSGIDLPTVELLEAASAIGVEFDSLTLSHLVDRDELQVEDQLALASRRELIEATGEVPVGDDVATLYRFRSVHLRSTLYQALSADRREALNRRRAALGGTV